MVWIICFLKCKIVIFVYANADVITNTNAIALPVLSSLQTIFFLLSHNVALVSVEIISKKAMTKLDFVIMII